MTWNFSIPDQPYKCAEGCLCCPKQMDHTPQGPSGKSLEEQIILKIYERFGRFPTEEELFQFVFGDDWAQFVIWNTEKIGCKCVTATKVM